MNLFAGLNEGDVVDVLSGLAFTITYAGGDGNNIWVSAHQAAAGDLDGSGRIDQSDLEIVLANFGRSVDAGRWVLGDADNDGEIGIADLDLVLANWSDPAKPPTPVPEPTTALLLVLGLATRTRRRKSNRLAVRVSHGYSSGVAAGQHLTARRADRPATAR